MTHFTGSCRCRTIRFDCELDFNLSSCDNKLITGNFRLLAGDHAIEVDESAMNSDRDAMHFFCSRCGAALVSREKTMSGMRYAVNIAALENVAGRNTCGNQEVTRTC